MVMGRAYIPGEKDLGEEGKWKMKACQLQKQDLEMEVISSVKSENGGRAGQ